MAKPLVSDELWAIVEPLLPPESPKPKGGHPRVPVLDPTAMNTGGDKPPPLPGCRDT